MAASRPSPAVSERTVSTMTSQTWLREAPLELLAVVVGVGVGCARHRQDVRAAAPTGHKSQGRPRGAPSRGGDTQLVALTEPHPTLNTRTV